MSADSRSASRCPFFTRLPWPAYRRTILPELTGPMTAVRSSAARIFPVARIVPVIVCGVTISVSIDWFAYDGAALACALVEFAAGGAERLHPAHKKATTNK